MQRSYLSVKIAARRTRRNLRCSHVIEFLVADRFRHFGSACTNSISTKEGKRRLCWRVGSVLARCSDPQRNSRCEIFLLSGAKTNAWRGNCLFLCRLHASGIQTLRYLKKIVQASEPLSSINCPAKPSKAP